MMNLREQAQKVLASCHLNRCEHRCERGYHEDLGEYVEGACEEGATHRITSPHEDRRWDYCEKCAREVHAGIEYNHRWSLWPIYGTEGILAARELAIAVMASLDTARDVVAHALVLHPLPWRVEHDWTYEVTAADGTIITKCQSPERAQAVVTMAEDLQAEWDALPKDDELTTP